MLNLKEAYIKDFLPKIHRSVGQSWSFSYPLDYPSVAPALSIPILRYQSWVKMVIHHSQV